MVMKKKKQKMVAEKTMGFSLMDLSHASPKDKFLSVSEAAKLRGTTTHAIRELVHRKRLPATEISGRYFITLSDLQTFEPMTHRQKFDAEAEGWFDEE
jgi:excisionase family DNA binding protein